MKEQLIDLVDEFGQAYADKSKLLHGLRFEVMGTFATSMSIDAAAVQRFAEQMRMAKYSKLFNRIFDAKLRYSLSPDATTIIRSAALPKHLLALYAACQVTKPRTPTLKVRQIVSE